MPIEATIPVNVGTRVSYEDMANPRKEGTVEAVLPSGEYRVQWDEGAGETTSDLRQYGWYVLADLPGSIFDGAEIIAAYTQARAIEDGVLVPLLDGVDEPALSKQAGFTAPVLLTRSLFDFVDANDREKDAGQSFVGRLWDVLNMGRFAIKGAPAGGSELDFRVSFHSLGRGRDSGRRTKRLRLVAGPDDHGDLCIVIGFPEDF